MSFDNGATTLGYASGYGFGKTANLMAMMPQSLRLMFLALVLMLSLWLPFGGNRRATFGLFPYGSFGLGWQSLAFRSVPINGLLDPITDDVSELRFVLALALMPVWR